MGVVSPTAAHIERIRSGPSGPRIGAYFDLDGTLINGYSAAALYEDRLRRLEVGPVELFHTMRLARSGAVLSEVQFRDLIERGIAGWQGRPEDDILELGERLWATQVAGRLFHEAFRIVHAHQEMGHTVAIATSATRLQVAPLAAELGVSEVLCTELEVEQGLLTGSVLGRPPWGEGKQAAVTAHAKRKRITRSRSWAYANGNEDVPFLSWAGNPVAVNPQPDLAAAAASRDWPVLTFASGPGRLDPLPAVRTGALYGGLIGSCLAGIGVGALLGDKRRGRDFALEMFGTLSGPLGDLRLDITGQEHVWSHRPAVFLINHQSALIDLVVVTQLLRKGATGVAKKEVASVPVLGPLLTWLDFAYIDRGSVNARAGLDDAIKRLREGVSIIISPEGTRSLTPKVGPFRKGAFHLASQAEVPIVPVVIRNAGELMWRGAKVARSGVVQVHVHPPIPTKGWTKADLDATVEHVHGLYVATLSDWEKTTQAT